MSVSQGQVDQLVNAARKGDPGALGELLAMHQSRLLPIIAFRMDSRLQGRFDASDVLQEAFVEATERFGDYLENQKMPFFLWLRFIAVQKLLQLHRKHLGVQARDAAREVSIYARPNPQATSAVLAAQLLGDHTSPSGGAVRAETQLRVERALNSMAEVDREVLSLRHFEHLSNSEVATVLDLSETAANNRYMRALKRLRQALDVT